MKSALLRAIYFDNSKGRTWKICSSRSITTTLQPCFLADLKPAVMPFSPIIPLRSPNSLLMVYSVIRFGQRILHGKNTGDAEKRGKKRKNTEKAFPRRWEGYIESMRTLLSVGPPLTPPKWRTQGLSGSFWFNV